MKRWNLKSKFFTMIGELPIGEREKIEIVRVGGERQLIVNGITRILHYGTDKMILALGKERLEIMGEGLDCMTYVSGAIGIRGQVDRVVFGGQEK